MNSPAIALVVFIFSYIFFIFLPAKRPHIAIGASILLLVTNTVSIKEAFLSVNWNVMGIFVGTLALADSFMESRVPAYVAEIIINKVKTTTWAILAVCLITGFISAFVENVATVLIVAPIAVSLARKLKISPVNMMIAVAVSSNLQGAATLIGDPPSMLLGGFARMNFMDFFFFKGRPSIFFAVEAGAAASLFVLYFFFKQYRQKPKIIPEEKIRSWVPAGLLAALIVLLALSSFFDTGFSYMAGLICTVFGAFSVLWERAVNKRSVVKAVRKLDWETTLFLMGVFILVGGMTVNGWIDRTSGFLSGIVGGNIFFGYTAIVFLSVLISAFVDNVPFLAAMLPVAIGMARRLSMDPSLFLFGLLIGASLGGNITPIGASANIVACGILKKEGYKVSFGQFMRIGVPFTVFAVGAAYIFLWFVWGH